MIDISSYEDAMFGVKEVDIPMPIMPNGHYIFDSYAGESSGRKMIVREDTGKPISVMSNDYKLISNKQLLEAALPMIDKYGGVVPSGNIKGDVEMSRVFGDARSIFPFDFPDTEVKIANGDYLHPRITLINSYDGTKRVGFKYGAYRLVCSNGLTIGQASTEQYMHLGSNTQLDDIGAIVQNVINKMQEMLGEHFGSMVDKHMKMNDITKMVNMFPQSLRGEVYAQIKTQDAWNVYNAGTYALSHLMDRSKESVHHLDRDIYKFIKRNAA